MKFFLLTFSLFLFSVNAQEFPYKKIRETKLPSKVNRISVDRLGGFYIVGDCGVEQFDPEGIHKKSYKLSSCNAIELLEAWPLMRICAYQNYKQQFTIFDSHLEEVEKLDIDPAFAVEPKLASLSTDLKYYWILDVDNSIKRVNINSRLVDIESDALKSKTGKFVHMREYQNMLFVLNENSGIYVINKLGTLIFEISASNVNYFSFAGEDLYFLTGKQVRFYDIFTKDSYSIDVPAGNKFVVATDERLILLKDGVAEIFEFSPQK
jgi:hypothetical protein